MKNYYLPEGTKYLTNNGLKCITELTEDDMIFTIDKFGNTSYTKDFEVYTQSYNSLTLNTDNNFQGLVSDIKIPYKDYLPCIKTKKATETKVEVNGEIYKNELNKDLVIAIALYVSNFFKKLDNNCLVSNKDFGRKTYKVLSNAKTLSGGIYFGYDKIYGNYSFNSKSFFKSFDDLCIILQDNIEILDGVIKYLKDLSYSYYKGFYNIDFKNYKLAETFSTLISLLGYKSRVKFDSDLKTFKVTYTNNSHQLSYDWKTEITQVNSNTPVLCYSLRLNTKSYIVVSQNNNKLTTTSIIQASYNLLEGDE